jgi:hypothetical protein
MAIWKYDLRDVLCLKRHVFLDRRVNKKAAGTPPRCLTPSPIASFIEGVQVFMTCGALMTELRKYDLICGQKLGKECVM